MAYNNNNTNTLLPDAPARDAVKKTDTVKAPASQGWTESSSDWDAPPAKGTLAQPPPSAPIALKAKDLSVCYGSKQALKDVSFTVYQGDTLGLLGLNGAGKSTLLRVLAGALAPGHGSVQIGNHELFEHTIAARGEIGYAPDKPAVYAEFRVIEFLKFIARMRRIPRTEIHSSVDNVIELCGLGEVRRRIIGNLSSGYQQRVNIAQAMIHSPRILILDEPANGLDPVQLMEMRDLVSNLSRQQATIFSSHLLSEVNAICNRVILIDHGRQIIDTSIRTLSDPQCVSFDIHLHSKCDFDLADLPNITTACAVSANQWTVAGNSLTAEHLKAMLHSRGIQVVKITAIGSFLESLFQQLSVINHRDPPAPLESNSP